MYPKHMSADLVRRAHRGDLTGMNFATLARLSSESRYRKHLKDQAEGSSRGPRTGMDINNRDEQVADCTNAVESQGGQLIYVYDEPHTSAYKRKRVKLDDGRIVYRVVRPVYQQALEDLRKGFAPNGQRLDGLMVPDLDRLTRDNRDLEDSIDVVVHAGRPILDLSGALDLLTDQGRTNARVIVAFKNAQSADTARRVKRKHQALQREGIPAGGPRPFGWQEDRRSLHPVEAPLLRTAVREILGGKSVASVAARWNQTGITTAQGKKWRAVSLKSVLRNPRMAGYRMITVTNSNDDEQTLSRHAVTLYDEQGQPVRGQWDPMISVQDWKDLTALIGEAPQRGDGKNARVYLLTGTLRCGNDGCDTLLRGTKAPASAGKPEGFFWYTCVDKGHGGCGGLKIDGPKTDTAVTKIVIAKYEQEAAEREATAVPQQWDKDHDLERVREDIAEAKAARRARKISAERYYADLAEYEAEEKALLREKGAFIRRAHAAAGAPVNLRKDWDEERLTLAEKRMYIERTLSAVIVHPARGRRNVDVRERIEEVPVTAADPD